MSKEFEEGMDCSDCIHEMCYDDGDGRWDLWCNADVDEQGGDDDFNWDFAKNCKKFVWDKNIMH